MAPNIIYAPPFICIQLLLCHCLLVQLSNVAVASASTDTITEGQTLGLSQTLTSSGQVFELGFFPPQNSTNFYLGIWYRKIEPRTVIWVGNRVLPLTSSSPYLTLEQGNLVIIDDRITYRVNSVSSARNMSLKLLDSGNLVLIDRTSLDVIWQSFDDPTDTFLPGMKLGIDKRTGKVWSLTAWEKENDPTPGTASLKLNPQSLDEFIILKGNETYWSSGSWNGKIFPNVSEMRLNYIFNFSFTSSEDISYFTYSLYDNYTSILSRCVLDISGQLQQMSWLDSTKQWNLFWAVPGINCDVYSLCGPFSSCNNATGCQCLKGFRPSDSNSWENGDTSGGCMRKVPLQCEESSSVEGEKDGFSMMQEVVAPLNPNITYASREECKSICLGDCSCNAYTYNSSGGCFLWSGDLLNLKQLDKGDPSGGQLYLKLAAYELQDKRGNKRLILKITVAATSPFLLLLVVTFVYCHRKKRQKSKEDATEDMQFFSVDMMGISAQVSAHSTDQTNKIAGSKDPQLPKFGFKSVSASTDDFSLENKLGEGGFGPVYKGKLLNGQEVAVKRLSRKSGQGLRELRTETTLIAKLQHRNLVRILGCCLEKDEKILIYELMPNGSLDSFLFNPSKRGLLGWKVRARIIEGIAQGLLYLHEHSRLRIIHRDLKASNILLDKDMNPKISDFGLAKMFGGNESQAKTFHIVGTYGYMSPEYALEGICSTKSDVFSFGVLLLEIISGKKNTGFYQSDSLNLLSYAWELWIGGIALQLVDPVLEDRCSDDTMMRYINIAFLCVHEIAADRPTMSEVVSMLVNENLALPSPKQPAFSYLPGATTTTVQPGSSMQPCSRNDVTISAMEAR